MRRGPFDTGMLRLVLAGLAHRRTQVVVTFLCLAMAFLLFGLFASLRHSLEGGLGVASSHRLRTQGASSLAAAMPLAYAERIAAVEGVVEVGYVQAFPAAFQDNPAHLLLQAVSVDNFFDIFGELQVPAAQRSTFASDKASLLAGPGAIERYGWTVGQDVVLQTNVANPEGQGSWTFHLNAVYASDDPAIPQDLAFVHYDYFNDARSDGGQDQVLGYIETIADPARAHAIAEAIDARFATSAPQLRTQPENQAIQKQLAQFGDIGAIAATVAAAVFLAMFLLANNVWYERATTRKREFATLKAIGFTPAAVGTMVVAEGMLVTLSAAALGLAAAWASSAWIAPHVSMVLRGFAVPASAVGQSLVLVLVLGFLSLLLPSRRAATASMEALRAP